MFVTNHIYTTICVSDTLSCLWVLLNYFSHWNVRSFFLVCSAIFSWIVVYRLMFYVDYTSETGTSSMERRKIRQTVLEPQDYSILAQVIFQLHRIKRAQLLWKKRFAASRRSWNHSQYNYTSGFLHRIMVLGRQLEAPKIRAVVQGHEICLWLLGRPFMLRLISRYWKYFNINSTRLRHYYSLNEVYAMSNRNSKHSIVKMFIISRFITLVSGLSIPFSQCNRYVPEIIKVKS